MSDNVCEDIKKAMNDTKSTFYVPDMDHHVRIISKEELILEQILKNQLLIMKKLQMDLDIYEKDFFSDAINATKTLLNGETK